MGNVKATLFTAAAVLAATCGIVEAGGIQTIDCDHDRNRTERAICASRHLQILDAKITGVYADAMGDRQVSASAKEALRRSQYAFLARRDACGSDTMCLNDVMALRLAHIRNFD